MSSMTPTEESSEVSGGGEAGVGLGDHDAVLLAGRDLNGHLAVGEGVAAEVLHDGQVSGGGVVDAGGDAGHGLDGVVQGDDGGLGQVLLGPGLAGGAGLAGNLHALGVQGLGRGLVGVGLDDDALVGVDVGVGEVNLLLALVGDGEVGDAAVSLAALLDERDDAVELHGRQVLAGEAHLCRDGVHEIDLKAHGGGAIHVVERRVGQVRGNDDLAVLDQGVAGGVCGVGAGGSACARVAAAACEHGCASRSSKAKDEVAAVKRLVEVHAGIPFPKKLWRAVTPFPDGRHEVFPVSGHAPRPSPN